MPKQTSNIATTKRKIPYITNDTKEKPRTAVHTTEPRLKGKGAHFEHIFLGNNSERSSMLTKHSHEKFILFFPAFDPPANPGDLRKLYRRQAQRYHPDNGGDDGLWVLYVKSFEFLEQFIRLSDWPGSVEIYTKALQDAKAGRWDDCRKAVLELIGEEDDWGW